ncbi:MAG: hypothetical protein M1825_001915 [Sarcosagium campestre]|nr:MAG: hypothetical protein M1825_001915 [Sarcosagium campestre]
MTSRQSWRLIVRHNAPKQNNCVCPRRNLCQSARRMQSQSPPSPSSSNEPTTHFGFETVAESAKASRVGAVFASVASNYDTMNDLMSLGIHRLWKDHFVRSLDPGARTAKQPPWAMLDVAGGTGDIAFRLLDHARAIHGDSRSHVTLADINGAMLAEGKRRSLDTAYGVRSSDSSGANEDKQQLSFLEANAESMPSIASNSIDLYTVAFGIRNFTNKDAALREAFRVLKPGGVFACLEFSKVNNPLLDAVYKRWSFGAIPLIGQLVAADRDSYQYLVESIERFPSQREFRDMIRDAGFVTPGASAGAGLLDDVDYGYDDDDGDVGWEDLTGGVAAIHKGVKPR